MFIRGRWELKVSTANAEGIFFHAWLSIPSGKKVLTPQGKQCCGEVVSAEGIDSQDGRNIH